MFGVSGFLFCLCRVCGGGRTTSTGCNCVMRLLRLAMEIAISDVRVIWIWSVRSSMSTFGVRCASGNDNCLSAHLKYANINEILHIQMGNRRSFGWTNRNRTQEDEEKTNQRSEIRGVTVSCDFYFSKCVQVRRCRCSIPCVCALIQGRFTNDGKQIL